MAALLAEEAATSLTSIGACGSGDTVGAGGSGDESPGKASFKQTAGDGAKSGGASGAPQSVIARSGEMSSAVNVRSSTFRADGMQNSQTMSGSGAPSVSGGPTSKIAVPPS